MDVSYLSQSAPPFQGNVDASTTGAFQQFVPAGVPGLLPTSGCEFELEGHYCPQIAQVALDQRAAFYRSAVEQLVPTIDGP